MILVVLWTFLAVARFIIRLLAWFFVDLLLLLLLLLLISGLLWFVDDDPRFVGLPIVDPGEGVGRRALNLRDDLD